MVFKTVPYGRERERERTYVVSHTINLTCMGSVCANTGFWLLRLMLRGPVSPEVSGVLHGCVQFHGNAMPSWVYRFNALSAVPLKRIKKRQVSHSHGNQSPTPFGKV